MLVEPDSGLGQQPTEAARCPAAQHRHQRPEVTARDFGGREPEDLLASRVARLNQPVVVHGQDAFRDVVEDRPQFRFALA